MVCEREVRVEMDLPENVLSQEEARSFDARMAVAGWRSCLCDGAAPRWERLRGHPVVVRQGRAGEQHRALIWRMASGPIDEMAIASDVDLQAGDSEGGNRLVEKGEQGLQLALL